MDPPPRPTGPENITKPPTLFTKLWAAFSQDQEPVNVTLLGLALLDLLDLIKNVIALTTHLIALFIFLCSILYAVSSYRFRCRRFTEPKHLVEGESMIGIPLLTRSNSRWSGSLTPSPI